MAKDLTSERAKNRLRRTFLYLSYAKARNYGKSIMALMLSRGAISESAATALTGLSILNTRAVISVLLSSGLIHVIGERQLRMKNRRRYVEMIFGIDPVAASRVLRDTLFNTYMLLKNVHDAVEPEQFAYLCEKDRVLFLESEINTTNYSCPLCGEPLTPIWIDLGKLRAVMEKIQREFRKVA